MRGRVRSLLLLVLGVTLAAPLHGCSIFGIGLRQDRTRIAPDDPIVLEAGADGLRRKRVDAVLVQTRHTLARVPLDSETIRRVAHDAMPAVASIYTETAEPYRVQLLPIPIPGTSFGVKVPGKALGSAFFVHPSAYLLSNNHVVANAVSIHAKTSDDTDYVLEVVARDPVLDIALLRAPSRRNAYPYIPLGRSDEVRVGDVVIAIGNPLGLGHTVTHGIISQTGRALQDLEGRPGRQVEFLQTDTPINPGNSGGPLLTLTGAAVGINTAILQGTQNIGFAVPESQIVEFVQTVIDGDGERE